MKPMANYHGIATDTKMRLKIQITAGATRLQEGTPLQGGIQAAPPLKGGKNLRKAERSLCHMQMV